MIFTITTHDEFYMNQLLAFLSSIKINSPNEKMKVCLVNFPKILEQRLRHSFHDFDFENRRIKMIDKRGISLILLRIELIKEYFELHGDSAAWIDTDVIVRDKLDPFLEIKPNQLKILFRGNHVPPKVRFNAGIFNMGCSDETYKLVCDWHRQLKKNTVWGMGQLELWKAYKNNLNVDLVKMSDKYNDLGDSTNDDSFAPTSVMWHSKKHHFENPKFQKEFQHYLKIGKEIFNATSI